MEVRGWPRTLVDRLHLSLRPIYCVRPCSGIHGFWGVPELLGSLVPYDQEIFGGALFFFLFWIFINVHHYFLDNVMWRRQNPETRKNLSALRRASRCCLPNAQRHHWGHCPAQRAYSEGG